LIYHRVVKELPSVAEIPDKHTSPSGVLEKAMAINSGINPAMDQHPTRQGEEILR